MGDPSGLTDLEITVLAAVAGAGGAEGVGPYRSTQGVLVALDRMTGLGPRHAYPFLVDLVQPWRRHLPLLDGQGNWGTLSGDAPADPQYTEVRLSPVGALALAAHAGRLGPLPLGIIDGTAYRGGAAPPFEPWRVIQALTGVAADLGAPAFPSGGTVAGDVEGLLAGRPVTLALSADVHGEPGQLVITSPPYGVTSDEVMQAVMAAVSVPTGRRYADYLPEDARVAAEQEQLARARAVPFDDIRDETTGRGLRVVFRLKPGVELDVARTWLAAVEHVTSFLDARLPSPAADLLAAYPRGDGSGLRALAALL